MDDDCICDKCGNTYADGSDVPADPEHTHSFGAWKYYSTVHKTCNEALFYRICSGCSAIEWRDGTDSDHSYVTVTTAPTCTKGGYDTKTCTVCGNVETCNATAMVAHTYGAYSFDSTYHWKKCNTCDNIISREEHTVNGDGICISCEQQLGPTAGILYDISVDGTYAEVIGYEGSAKNIVIADSYNGRPVKTIYKNAFYDNDNITSVMIPDSVTEIGASAFYSCNALTTVTFGNGVTTIGSSAFHSCNKITSITLPDSLERIYYYAFAYCSKLSSVTLPDGVIIGQEAFLSCHSTLYTEYEYGKYVAANGNPYAVLIDITNKNFTTYTIHEDCSIIAALAFNGCERLTNIYIHDGITAIGDGAFFNCFNLSGVYITDITAWCNISFIYSNINGASATSNPLYYGANLYLNGELVTELVIPEGITKIGSCQFYNYDSLTSVTIPDSVTSIGDYAFSGCDGLTSVTIPDSVTSISEYAFAYCSNLTSVTIPDSVTSIGNYAFHNCSNIRKVYYAGTAEQWAQISIGSGQDSSFTSSSYRYYYSETEPETTGRFWHYDESGNIVIW